MHLFRILLFSLYSLCFCTGSAALRAANPEPQRVSPNPANRSFHDTLLSIYTAEIGVREQGLNAGKRVEEYLNYVGLGKGYPWCAAFVSWAHGKAGLKQPRSAWSPDLFKDPFLVYTRSRGWNKEPCLNPGDVFGIWFPAKHRIAHVGFIHKMEGNWITTVEGNTTEAGSREGDGVYSRRRLLQTIYKTARYYPAY